MRISPIAQLEFGHAQLVIEHGILTGDAQGSLIIGGCALIVVVSTRQITFFFQHLDLVSLVRLRHVRRGVRPSFRGRANQHARHCQ